MPDANENNDAALRADWTHSPDDLRYRASIYLLLSSVFAHEPTVEGLRDLAQTGASALADEAVAVSEEKASDEAEIVAGKTAASPAAPDEEAAMATLFKMLAGLGPEVTEEDRRRIATEYAELFVGPRPPLAPLYESVYLGFPSRLFTDQTRKVRAAYERCGFDVSARGHVPDDHVAYELEFVSNMLCRLADMQESGSDDATSPAGDPERVATELSAFLGDHLGGWIGLFADRVAQAQAGDYYRTWAEYAHAVVTADVRALSGK